MGYILQIKCNVCNELKQFHLGQSIKDCRLNEVLLHFGEKEQQKIQSILGDYSKKTNSTPMWNYENKLGYCEVCNKLVEVPTFTLFLQDHNIYVESPCECGHLATIVMDSERIDQKDLTCICPCKNGTLEFEIVGMWD